MEQMIIRICIVLLGISNICLLVVMIKITDRISLHGKLISEILKSLCDAVSREDDDGIE